MLGNSGFDLWADGYDKSVGLSDENGSYPFAGYRQILNEVYNRVLSGNGKNILDIGFGTGTLTAKLYEMGCSVRGQDFSEKMIELAKQGIAIIMISSEMPELIGMSDRVMVMSGGKVTGVLEGEEAKSQQRIMNLAFGGN